MNDMDDLNHHFNRPTRANDPEWQEERAGANGEDTESLMFVLFNGTYGMGYDDDEAFFIFRRIIKRLEAHMGSAEVTTATQKTAGC